MFSKERQQEKGRQGNGEGLSEKVAFEQKLGSVRKGSLRKSGRRM